MEVDLIKLTVVGLVTSIDFQKCRYVSLKLHNCIPQEYAHPEIRAMFDVEWTTYLLKMGRRHGGRFWTMQHCAVLMNDQLLGSYSTLISHISKKYRFLVYEDWYSLSRDHVVECLTERTENFRQLVYFNVAVKSRSIGTMLFLLYNDLVPKTCENFLNKYVENEIKHNIPLNRIVEKSWIQFGYTDAIKSNMPCENYVVPHDQRGVISMCNDRRHRNNTLSFTITLDAAPWMDYKYVAFGQLLQGEDVLRNIEKIPTYYESPAVAVEIVKAGEFPLPNRPTEAIYSKEALDSYFESVFLKEDIIKYLESYGDRKDVGEQSQHFGFVLKPDTPIDQNSDVSTFSFGKLEKGLYSFPSDKTWDYRSFMHLPDYLTEPKGEDEDPCNNLIKEIDEKRLPFYLTPSSSDISV